MRQLVDSYLEDLEHRAKRPDSVRSQMRHVLRLLGECGAEEIGGADLAVYRRTRYREGAAVGTVNRELTYLRAAYRRAAAEERIESVPRFAFEREPRREQGWASAEEVEAIARHLPHSLDELTRLAFATGWRKAALCGLQWRDYDLAQGELRLRPELAKSGEGLSIPLAGALARILSRLSACRADDCEWILHREGRPVGDFRKSWARAKEAAGIGAARRLRFHDLRASFVVHMAEAGVSESVIMRLAQMSRQTFDRYRRLRPAELREALERADQPLRRAPSTAGRQSYKIALDIGQGIL